MDQDTVPPSHARTQAANGEMEEAVKTLNTLFEVVEVLFVDYPDLLKSVKYSVKPKGQNEQNRIDKMLKYRGPDPFTRGVLNEHAARWLTNPDVFWLGPWGSLWGPPCPTEVQAQITASRSQSPQASAQLLFECRPNDSWSVQDIERHISAMVDAGSRYRNIDQALGFEGSIFLGMDIAESSWKKLLPKKGPDFDRVVERLSATGLRALSDRFPKLQSTLVQYQLNFLLQQQHQQQDVVHGF